MNDISKRERKNGGNNGRERDTVRTWRKKSLAHCTQKSINTVTIKKRWAFLKGIKIELPHDSAIPLPCMYPKEVKSTTQNNFYTP